MLVLLISYVYLVNLNEVKLIYLKQITLTIRRKTLIFNLI